MNQDEIKISARMLRRWYDTEKKKILADLNREFFAKQNELTEMCKSIGHDFVNLPNIFIYLGLNFSLKYDIIKIIKQRIKNEQKK